MKHLPANWEVQDLAAFCEGLRAMPEAQFRALAQPIMARIDAAKTIPAKWAVRRELTLEQDMILNVAGSRLNFDLSFEYLD